MTIDLPDAEATDSLGRRLGRALYTWEHGLVVALAGELGAGKTALTRAVLGELGEPGAVVSPSYTLVEPYAVAGRTFYHVDLYRLADPAELDFLGIRDIDPERDWLFVEWAENGGDELPPVDLRITLSYQGTGRIATLAPATERGAAFLERMAD